MEEFQIYNALASIRERLSPLRKESPRERLTRQIFEPATRIARSEVLVDPEELAVLMDKVEKSRDFIFRFGKPFTQHPEYQHMNPVFLPFSIASTCWEKTVSFVFFDIL